MEIVQLSDLHIGAQFREEVFGNVIDELNSLKPEAVVITGDLTNEGLIEQYEKCKNLVSQIKVEKIIAISGLDCSGKSTQIDLLKKYYDNKRANAIIFWSRGGYTPGFQIAKNIIRYIFKSKLPKPGITKTRKKAVENVIIRKII